MQWNKTWICIPLNSIDYRADCLPESEAKMARLFGMIRQ